MFLEMCNKLVTVRVQFSGDGRRKILASVRESSKLLEYSTHSFGCLLVVVALVTLWGLLVMLVALLVVYAVVRMSLVLSNPARCAF